MTYNSTKRKVTREELAVAVMKATEAAKDKFPRTKLAYYCERFLKDNAKTIKAQDKEREKITRTLMQELQDTRIENALEKDGKIWLDEKDRYQYDKAGMLAIEKKQREIAEKTFPIVEEFMSQEVEVVCNNYQFPAKDVPAGFDYDFDQALNGFAFVIKNEFEEVETK